MNKTVEEESRSIKKEQKKGSEECGEGRQKGMWVKGKERDSWLDKRGGNSVSAPFIFDREGQTCAK